MEFLAVKDNKTREWKVLKFELKKSTISLYEIFYKSIYRLI